jgi:hypothetical protein
MSRMNIPPNQWQQNTAPPADGSAGRGPAVPAQLPQGSNELDRTRSRLEQIKAARQAAGIPGDFANLREQFVQRERSGFIGTDSKQPFAQ